MGSFFCTKDVSGDDDDADDDGDTATTLTIDRLRNYISTNFKAFSLNNDRIFYFLILKSWSIFWLDSVGLLLLNKVSGTEPDAACHRRHIVACSRHFACLKKTQDLSLMSLNQTESGSTSLRGSLERSGTGYRCILRALFT